MIKNLTKNINIVSTVSFADQWLSKMKGLIGKKSFTNTALIITKCNQIHSFFMKFSIDCLFLDNNHFVIATIPNLKPWRVSPKYKNAVIVVELPVGSIHKSNVEVGDQIHWEKRRKNGYIT